MKEFFKNKFLRHGILLLVTIFTFNIFDTDAQAQNKITGSVLNAAKEPLPSVTIANKKANIAVTTNENGQFSITAKKGDVIEASMVGYNSQTIAIKNTNIIVFTLEQSEAKMNEVVVVGYGTQKKVNVSGSVNTVKVGNLINRPVTDLTSSLQGQVAGVTVVGRPGDVGQNNKSINIQGRGNLGGSDPFYVVDGVPVTVSDFNRINPSDIESMSILKDAAASSIYGSRAAYGVILVTTKKGKEGKMQLSFNGYYGVQTPTVLPHTLDAANYARLRNEAAQNDGKGANYYYTNEEIQKFRDGSDPDNYPNTNWYDLAYKKNAPIWLSEISAQGGGKTQYFLSGSVMKQGSLVPGKDLTRYSLRSNTSSQVTSNFRIGSNLSYIRDGYNFDGAQFSYTTLAAEVPTMVNKQSDGTWGTMNAGTLDAGRAKGNPIRTLQEGGRSSYETNRFIGSLNANLGPIKGMNLNGMVSYNLLNYRNSSFSNYMDPVINWQTKEPIPSTASSSPNRLSESWENSGNLLLQFTGDYEKTIKNHNLKILLGTSYEDYVDRTLGAWRQNFVSNDLNVIDAGDIGTTSNDLGNNGSMQQRTFNSYFGRLNYNYSEKYFVEANIRRDASSQFAPGRRWGTFPSVSAAWRISKESFFKNVKGIDELKLRASWGKLGNVNNVGYYDYFDGLSSGTVGVLNNSLVSGVYQTRLANPNLTWEVVDVKNIGLDGTFFNHRLTVQADVFNRMTSDILLNLPVPYEWGVPGESQPQNAGKVQNKGVELTLNYSDNIGDFHYSVGGNMSRIWNKIIDLHGQDNQIYSDGEGTFIYKEGQAIGSFYMIKSDGLFVDQNEINKHAFQSSLTKPGDIKYIDQNKDGTVDGSDRVITGNNMPYFTYSLNLSLSYKGFDVNAMGQGVGGGVKVYLQNEASWAFFNGGTVKEYHLGRWTPQNPDPHAIYPRLSESYPENYGNDFWMYNADYFRIKVLSVGYTLPQNVISKMHLQKLRLYLSSNNLFTFSSDKRLKDFDPEVPSSRATFPQLKSVSAGLHVIF